MQSVVNQVHKLLIRNKKTIAVAESCTGGLLSNFLTRLSGSSKFFILGVVAYSNKAKEIILKVPLSLIVKKGAVSPEVTIKMAEGIRKIAKSDFGIGVTGIAGPRGGTSRKPVGTVFIAINSENKRICKKFYFKGNRSIIRKKTALVALELLKNY
jgi:nicotinamide-nucleotide amidase